MQNSTYSTSGQVPEGPFVAWGEGSWHGNRTGMHIGFLDGRVAFYNFDMIQDRWSWASTNRNGPYAFNH